MHRSTCKQYSFRSFNIYFQCYAFWWRSFHKPERNRKQKGLLVSNFALLWVVFKWHHASERVNCIHVSERVNCIYASYENTTISIPPSPPPCPPIPPPRPLYLHLCKPNALTSEMQVAGSTMCQSGYVGRTPSAVKFRRCRREMASTSVWRQRLQERR